MYKFFLENTARLASRGEIGAAVRKRQDGAQTHLRRRLSCTMHSTLSHLQLPQGAPSTTSHRTLRALQDTQALAARLLVIFPFAPTLVSEVEPVLCFCGLALPVAVEDGGGVALVENAGEFGPASTELAGAGDTDRWFELLSSIPTTKSLY